MKPRLVYVCLASTLLIFTACAPAPAPVPEPVDTTAEDEAAIRALRAAFTEAQGSGDVDTIVSSYASDAILMRAGAPTVSGLEPISALLAENFEQSAMTVEDPIDQLVVLGDWAFDRTSFSGTQTNRESGETVDLEGKAIHIYRRQADGSWKIAIDMYNFDQPMESNPDN